MRHHLEDVIPTHRPRKVNHGTPGIGVMNLLPIGQNQSFPGSDAPDHGDIVFLAAACRASLAGGKGVGVGKAKTPSDATFRVGDAFSAGYGGEVYGVEGTVAQISGGVGGGAWHVVVVLL